MNKILRLTLMMLLAMVGMQTWADEVTDELTVTSLGLPTDGTSYAAFSDKTVTSAAVYAGNVATNKGAYIQLRSSNNNSGIVSTTSGGTLKKVSIQFNSSTTANKRKVDVYGSTTAYTSASQLYGSSINGEKIGSVTYDGTTTTYNIEVSGNYQYVGFRSNSGAVYLDKVTIVWDTAGGTTTTVTAPEISGETPFTDKTTVTITVPTGTTVYYTTDGSMPSDQGDDYQEPFEISATTTVKAVAYDSEGNHSSVVSKEFVKQANVTTTGSGTEADPYTCADVIALVNGNATPSDNVYVKGKVSTASTDTQANITQYGNATFYISDDGTATNQVQAFRNKNFNEEKYTSTSEIPQLGDDVVLCGKPTLYNGTIELASGNYLVSVIHNSVKVDTLSFTASEALAQLAAGTQPTGVCYISGTISQDVDTTGVAQYGNLTYYISDDGTETNQLEVFRGKSFNGEKFNSDFLLKKGDKVKILGRIINYTDTNTGTTTPEVTSGSVLVEYNGVTTGITNVKGDGTNVNAPAYNLAGQRVGKDYKGVVIQNGKKCIRK